MPTWNRSGTVSRESLLTGEWTELYVVIGGTTLRLGSVKNGKLNIRKKFLVHRGMTRFGRRPDRADCLDVRMTFEGRLDEIHRENVLFLLNRPPDEPKVPAAGDDPEGRIEIPDPHYPMQFFTLYGRRPYPETGEDLVFIMWKCRCADFVRLAMMRDGMRFKAVGLSDKDGLYGGSAGSPYGWIYGYDASAAPPVPPPEHYWEFFGTVMPNTEYLDTFDAGFRTDFTPSLNSNDFSVVGEIIPDDVGVVEDRGILTKWSGGSNKGWRLIQREDKVVLSTSPNKVAFQDISVGGLVAGVKSFVAGVFRYVAPYGANSYGKVFCDAASAVDNTFYGPVVNNSLIDPWVARCQGLAAFDGKIYWLAYYNMMLSDAEINDLRSGTKTPQEIPNLYMLITFDRNVAAAYVTESGLGPNAPYSWTVNGIPMRGP